MQDTEVRDLPVYLQNMLIDQIVHSPAWFIRAILEAEESLHFIQGHAQGPATADEVQTVCVAGVV